MRVIGRRKIEIVPTTNKSKTEMLTWLCEVEESNWNTFDNIKKKYKDAEIAQNGSILFYFGGRTYQLTSRINFRNKILLICELINKEAELNLES